MSWMWRMAMRKVIYIAVAAAIFGAAAYFGIEIPR